MSTQGTAARVQLPDEVQSSIRIAEAKVAVLRDEEIALSRAKGQLEKDIAALEIKRDTLEGVLPKLEKAVVTAQGKLDDLSVAVASKESELHGLENECRSAVKARDEAVAVTAAESAKLSRFVEKTREVQSGLDAEKAKLEEDKAVFAQRKATVREMLASI